MSAQDYKALPGETITRPSLQEPICCRRTNFVRKITKELILFFLVVCALPGFAGHIKVYVLTGQSNSLGTSNGTEIDKSPGNYQADAQILFWWENWASAGVSIGTSTNRITHLQVQQGGYYAGSATHWGPEFAFGRALWNSGERDFMIIKCSRGGGGNTFWHKPATDHHMYDYIRNAVSSAVGALTNAGHTFEICGLLYLQGESNSSTEANEAGTRFRALLDNLRLDLPHAARMRGYIAGIAKAGTDPDMTRARHDALHGQFAPEIIFFPDLDLSDECVPADNLHFNVRAKLIVGARFADAVLGRLAAYSADLVSTSAQNPMLQGWSETVATSTTGQEALGLAPDPGFTNNCWRISDASESARGCYYSKQFSSVQCSWAAGLGWSLTVDSRLISGCGTTNKAWFLQYGDYSNRWVLWAHLDPSVQLLLSWDKDAVTMSPNSVVVQARHDGKYHSFALLNDLGAGPAAVMFDGQIVGQILPIAVSVSALPAGINWGTASTAGMVKANWRKVSFELGRFSAGRAECLLPNTCRVPFESHTNRTYSLARTTNLLNWSTVATNIAGNGGLVWVSDTNAPPEGAFYRLRINP